MDALAISKELREKADELEAAASKMREAAVLLNGDSPRRGRKKPGPKPGSRRRSKPKPVAAVPEGPLLPSNGSSGGLTPVTSADTEDSQETEDEPAAAGTTGAQPA